MKVCFFGNAGHFFTAFLAKNRLPDLEYAGYCPGFPGEDMARLKLFAGKAAGEYPDGWEIHARTGKASFACDPRPYAGLDEMLDRERPDILVVDGRFTEHCQPAKRALERGVNVYVNKPIAVTLSDLMELYEAVRRSGKLLWGMHTVRYDAWYHTARRLVREGAVGRVRMVNCQKSYRMGARPAFYGDRALYGGTIPWVTSHSIDMIRMVTSREMTSVYSQQSRADNFGYGDLEVITTSCFEMEDDILATVNTDYYRPENTHSHDDDRLRVVGTKGILEVIRLGGDHEVRLANDHFNGAVEQDSVPFIFEDFVHALEGHGTGLLDADESFRNAYVAICAQQSADEKRIVPLENLRELFSL